MKKERRSILEKKSPGDQLLELLKLRLEEIGIAV